MECNFNRAEIAENVKNARHLCGEKTRIDMDALNAIKNVLKHCENHTLHFSDKEDDDENFTVNIFTDWGEQENHLVDSIRVEDNDAVLINCGGEDYWTWETDKSVTEIYQYMMDEIEFEFDQMYNN
jgi:hypothetical protein